MFQSKPAAGVATFHLHQSPRYLNNSRWKKLSPLETAVLHDDVDACRALFEASDNWKGMCGHDVIRQACNKGSDSCLVYLLRKCPEAGHINHKANPNCFVIAFRNALTTSRILLQSGVAWSHKDFVRDHDGQTILHMIYQNAHYLWMKELTELVFSCGFRKADVNLSSWSGATAVHTLVGNVFRKSFPLLADGTNRDSTSGPSMSECIIETLEYLVNMGVDLHAVDNAGRGVVHYLMLNASQIYADTNLRSFEPQNLPQMNAVLLYLLRKGIDINACNLPGTSAPITWLASLFCDSSIDKMNQAWEDVYVAFKIICEFGGDVNVVDTKGISPISLILTACNRWIRYEVSTKNVGAACCYVKQIQSLIQLFLDHGFNPSPDLFEFYLKQVAILLNIIDEGVVLEPLLRNLRDLILPFFLVGYNPNSMRMILDRDSENELCSLHARFYITRSFIIHRGTQAAFEFLSLFENTLDQPSFVKLINSMCHILINDFPHISSEENTLLIEELEALTKHPKSLLSLARIAIATSLQWNLLHKVDFLPLPNLLKSYMLKF